jgi:hypothetical protein
VSAYLSIFSLRLISLYSLLYELKSLEEKSGYIKSQMLLCGRPVNEQTEKKPCHIKILYAEKTRSQNEGSEQGSVRLSCKRKTEAEGIELDMSMALSKAS